MSEVTCKVKLDSPIGLAAGEPGRYAMDRVAFVPTSAGKAIAVATNGKMFAARDIECETASTPRPTFVPGKLAEKAGQFTLNGEWRRDQLGKRGQVVKTDVKPAFDEELRFPPVKSVATDIPADSFRIVLDARLLCDLQNALGGESLTLFIPTDPAKVVHVIAADGIGAIMPITRDGVHTDEAKAKQRKSDVGTWEYFRDMIPERITGETVEPITNAA